MGQWFDRKGGRVTKESSSSSHWFKSLCRGFSSFFFFFEIAGPPSARPPCPGPTFLPRRLWGRRGFTRQPKNSKRAHFRTPALQKHHQNSTKGRPREGEKNENCGGRGKKKSEGRSGGGCPTEGCPAEGGVQRRVRVQGSCFCDKNRNRTKRK